MRQNIADATAKKICRGRAKQQQSITVGAIDAQQMRQAKRNNVKRVHEKYAAKKALIRVQPPPSYCYGDLCESRAQRAA